MITWEWDFSGYWFRILKNFTNRSGDESSRELSVFLSSEV